MTYIYKYKATQQVTFHEHIVVAVADMFPSKRSLSALLVNVEEARQK